MRNLFSRRDRVTSTVKSSLQKINEAALALVASANEGHRGGRTVTKGAALEIVRRSLAGNESASFSVKKFHALKQVSEYIVLAQRGKVITASAAHFDLLPIGHPSSRRDHSLSSDDVMRARARWYADDSRVVDESVVGLLATAFTADRESGEYQYAAARLSAMGASRVPLEALVAVAVGFNDGANRGFWRQQLRERNGRFAKMFGKLRKLINKGGQIFAQYGDVVSANPRDETFVMETPDGRLIRTEATRVETEVRAILPSQATPDGVSAKPVKSSSADPVDDEANLVYVDQPDGFLPAGTPFTPNGMDISKIDKAWEDDLGNYQVVRGDFRDGEGQEFVVSRLEEGQVIPIAAGKRWSDVVKAVDVDEPKFQKGDDAEPNLPEGFDLSPAPREDIDPKSLTPDELAAGYAWDKSGNKFERDNFEIEQLPDGKWLLTENGDEGAFRESGPFDTAADAFEQGQIDANGPDFDAGAVMDFRGDQGGDGPPEAPTPTPSEPGDFYNVDRGPYTPQGPQDGVESDDYTDDPVELAQRFDSEDLEGSLEEAVRNGSGEALLPFGEGDEYVPAEAMYNALKEQGRDADQLLDDIYDGAEPTEQPKDVAPEDVVDAAEEQGPVTPEQVAELRAREDNVFPPLLDALSDEEIADIVNNEDYSAYLPKNEKFDVPEGMYEMDPNPVDPADDLSPDEAPEGAPNNSFDMAMDMSSEDLENGLRGAVQSDDDSERLGYYPISVFDEDGEEFSYDVPAEAWRDALQLQGIDTNDILRETYDGGEPTADEIDQMVENEEIKDGGEPGADSDGTGPSEGEGTVPESGDDGRGLGDGESPWSSLDNPVPEAARAAELRENNKPTPEIFELDPEADAEAFVQMMEGLKDNNKYASSVFIYELDEYKNMRLFSTADGKAGFGLKPNGDIVSVYIYADSDHRGGVQSMLAQAVELGGDRLDAYDTVLPAIYAEAGFKPVSRVRWDKNFEPDGWNKETYKKYNKGEPDVVAMAYDPDRIDSKYDPTEGEYFDDYEEAMAARDASIDGAPPVVDESPDTGDSPLGRTYDISDWEQVGGQGGSNEGGLYEDADGNQYYVKFPPQKQLRNELLASALYEKAGVPVGRVYLGRDGDGKEVLVSPMLENAKPLKDYLDDQNVMDEAAMYFPVDAWLNNWDSVGLVYDNMVVADDTELGVGQRVFRIDAGGALIFRAQGGDKDLPEDVQLIDSLRNPDINSQAATVYGDLTDEDIKSGVGRMLPRITDENIDELVDAAFSDDPSTAELMKERLKSRRDYLVERFNPTTPEDFEAMEADEEEALAEAKKKVDEVFADNPLVLDFDGDVQAQVEDAIENQRDLVFSYNGVDRVVRPVMIETNENTGNTNISAVDGEGNFKKFTISKMSAASNSDDTVDEVVGEDSAGEEIETLDAEPPQSLEEWEKDLLKVVDEMYSTPNFTSQDVEDLGEQPDINDEITSDFVSKIDSYDADAPQLDTPEQKVMADTVEQLINPEDGADAPSTEQILEGTNTPGNTEPDIIWQRVQDEFEGTVLPNGHVVVSSTMHGDRRYDVVVRRANDNTFHIYHRVTYPDGSTRVKEMGGQGWHSAEALFSRVNNQIFNSKNRPKSTVNKALKQENTNTLYADTSTPTQPGSYVAADGSVVKRGDRVTVVNPTHSKFGMGARIVSVKRKYSSDGKKYTDYLRVKYDDGTKNNIVSTSVVPEGNEGTLVSEAPSKAKLTPSPSAVKVATAKPGDSLSGVETASLPKGAVVYDSDGRYWEHVAGISWQDVNTQFKKTVLSASDSFIYFAPDRDSALQKLGASNPDTDVEADTTARSAPSSWTAAERDSNGDALDEFTLPDDDDVVEGRFKTYQEVVGGSDYKGDFNGFSSGVDMETPLTEYLEAQGKSVNLPKQAGRFMHPGVIAKDSLATQVKNKNSSYSPTYIVDSVDFETGRVSVVVITGPDKTKRFVDIDPSDLKIESGRYLPVYAAASRFGIEYSKENLQDIRFAKSARQNPGFYSNEDAVAGPGAEAPEVESLPDWGSAPEGVISTIDALSQIRQWDSLGDTTETSMGIYTLMDSTSIEDGQVRIQQVYVDGDKKIRLTGKLTSWFANKSFIPAVTDGEIEAERSDQIEFDFYQTNDIGGLSLATSEYIGKEYYVDENNNGETYTYTTERGYEVKVHRAVKANILQNLPEGQSEVDYFKQRTSSDKTNVSLHNMFDILLPEDASSGDIQRALESLGVQQARPATDVDVNILKENKLITVFGKKRDGTKNFTGVLREQELQKIEKSFGITVDDLELEASESSNQRPQFLLSQAKAQKIVDDYKISHFYHRVYTSDLSGSNLDPVVDRIINIFEGGALQSTTSRMLSTRGIGQSSSDDLNRPAADYTFLYAATEGNISSSAGQFASDHWNDDPGSDKTVTIIVDPVEMMRRVDFYTNPGDEWGAMADRIFDPYQNFNFFNSSGEAMFKYDIPISSFRGIAMTNALRQKIVAELKARGIDFINGNDVEQLVQASVEKWKSV